MKLKNEEKRKRRKQQQQGFGEVQFSPVQAFSGTGPENEKRNCTGARMNETGDVSDSMNLSIYIMCMYEVICATLCSESVCDLADCLSSTTCHPGQSYFSD